MLTDADKKIGRELKQKLLDIRNSEDFADAVIANSETAENWERILNLIKKGERNVETILAFSIYISDFGEEVPLTIK